MPAIGLGTFGSDSVSGTAIAEAVLDAGRLGYRHFDCAAVYGNEHLIGPSLKQLIGEGVKREDLWITSKLWNDKHAQQDVIPTFQKSLAELQLAYLDLYLVHWPFPNFHPAGCDVNFHDPNAKSYLHENFMKTWRELEKLVDQGLVRHIGTSNMTVPKLKLVLQDARIRPACNEMELHPHFQQPELFDYRSARKACRPSATVRLVLPAGRNATARPRTRLPPRTPRHPRKLPRATGFTRLRSA